MTKKDSGSPKTDKRVATAPPTEVASSVQSKKRAPAVDATRQEERFQNLKNTNAEAEVRRRHLSLLK